MIFNKSTKILAAVTAFLLGTGAFVDLLFSVKGFISYYADAPFSFPMFFSDAITVAMVFCFSAAGFYFARDLKNSLKRKGEMPSIRNDSWLFVFASFGLLALRSFFDLIGLIYVGITNAPQGYAQNNPQTLLSSLLVTSFLVLLGMTIAKISLNIGLDLMLYERATPHIIRKLKGENGTATEVEKKPKSRKKGKR